MVFDYLWDKAKSREFPVLLSALVIAETHKKKGSAKLKEAVFNEFLDCINEDFVQVIEIDREKALHAHQLCRKYAGNGLMPSDALHLACALAAGCDVLLAWDGPLTSVTHTDIRIEPPSIYDRTFWTVSEIATPEEVKEYEEKNNPKPTQPSAAGVSGSSLTATAGKAGTETKTDSPAAPKEKEGLTPSTDASPSPKA